MFLLHIQLCRDAYSYEPLKTENLLHYDTVAEAARMFERSKRDYQQYVERKEDSVSMAKIEMFQKNPETHNFDFQQEWEFRLPLKKLTVVNPELKAFREKNPPKEVTLRTQPNPILAPDVFMEVQEMLQQANLAAEVAAVPQGGF